MSACEKARKAATFEPETFAPQLLVTNLHGFLPTSVRAHEVVHAFGGVMTQWGNKTRDAYAELKDWFWSMVQHAQELAQKELQHAPDSKRLRSVRTTERKDRALARLQRLRASLAEAERKVPPTRRAREELGQLSKSELYQQAKVLGIVGRSRMRKEELRRAIEEKR